MKIQATKLWSPLRLGWLCWCVLTATLPAAEATKVTLLPSLQARAKAVDARQQAFLDAMLSNDVAGAKAALQADRSLAKTITTQKIPVIIYATMLGPEMTALLLEHGADPNVSAPEGNGSIGNHFPLEIAAFQADEPTTAVLLKAGANPQARSADQGTALHRLFQHTQELARRPARSKQEVEIAKQAVARLLMSAGADPINAGGNFGDTFTSMIASPDPNWLAVLAESAPDLTKLQIEGELLLHAAALRGNSEAIRHLLNRKLDPNQKNKAQLTALQLVALNTSATSTNALAEPLEPRGYWNLLAAQAKLDAFSLAALGKLTALKELARQPGFRNLRHENGQTLLHWAASTGQSQVIQWLLAEGMDADATDNQGSLPLHLALARQQQEATSLLLSVTKQKMKLNSDGKTPLTIALETKNDQAIAELLKHAPADTARQLMLDREFSHFLSKDVAQPLQALIVLGANQKVPGDNGKTALHVAVKSSPALTRQLLIEGMSVDVRDQQGRTPLLAITAEVKLPLLSPLALNQANRFGMQGLGRARQEIALQTIKLLLEHGADINARDGDGNTPLHLACNMSGGISQYGNLGDNATTWLSFLLEKGANPNAQNRSGQTPLHLIITNHHAQRGDEEAFARVLGSLTRHKANLDLRDKQGNAVLHLTTRKNQAYLSNALLKAGADPNIRDKQGETPLMARIQQFDGNYLKTHLDHLLQRGADATLLDNEGRSIWQMVGEHKAQPFDHLRQMLDAGISPAITNRLGQNALHLGGKHNFWPDIITRMLETKLELEVPDQTGRLPLHWLLSDSQPQRISSPLFTKAINLNTADREGNTPLHLACLNNLPQAMTSLLSRGVDASLKNKSGDTPLWLSLGKNPVPNSRSSGLFRGSMQAVHLLPRGITNDIINSAGAGDLATVKQLLAWEPRLLTVEREGHNALHAAAFANQRETADYLLRAGAEMDDFAAVGLGDLEFLNRSAKDRPEVWKEAEKLRDLMMLAARRDNPGIIDWLVAQGGKPDETIDPHTGISALGWAMKLNLPLVVEALRRHGAKPSVFDAISLKRPELIRELTPHHAAWLSRTNESGMTPLLKAISDRDIECVKALLEAGANPNQEAGKPGLPSALLPGTPFQMALQRGHPATVDLLLQHGLDLKQRNVLGFTPLHLAAWHGSTNRIRELIERGGDINERQGKPNLPSHYQEAGQTALHLAVIRGIPSHVDFLLKNGASRQMTNNLGERPVEMLKTLRQPVHLGSSANGPSMNIIRMPFIHPSYPPGMVKAAAWDEIETLLGKEP